MNISHDELVFVPLGGSGEIGMNVNLYHYQSDWLMIDLGISFSDETTPGVDIILPDIRFAEAHKENLKALILTHAHEDHFGAIPYLWDRLRVPIYGTAFTLALLRRKLAEAKLSETIPLYEIHYNKEYNFGAFDVEFIALSHSIPDPAAIVIKTDQGQILHTGDWKLDDTPMLGNKTDTNRLKQIGDEGVIALIGDSTNAMVEGRTPSESVARQGLTEVMAKAKKAVAVTCFASNVARIDSIVAAAKANSRHVCVVGRALHRAISAARDTGYLTNLPDFVSEEDAGLMPRENLVIICTGSQGEVRAALAKIANNMHENIHLQSGDMVIYSSRQIPGNENAIAKVQNQLLRRKIEIITDEEAPVHVSGHPARDELSDLYHIIRPQIAIPVHGTARHLEAHAKLAKACQVPQTLIPENGNIISFQKNKANVIDTVEVSQFTHESGNVIDLQSDMLRSRRQMLWNGSVSVSILLDSMDILIQAPTISQEGVCLEEEESDYLGSISLLVDNQLEKANTKILSDDNAIKKMVIGRVKSATKSRFRIRPKVHMHVIRISA
ncbi:ribonuclease J [Alphaproteobacteria bacterium]|jgi:ribonuclease J|nr:ribonuclease J [Alphaproteobacteria bacterium]MDA9190310.1 ribonuclease J [Alphaproteobacteria bacterium]